MLDTALDRSLIGYSKLGYGIRRRGFAELPRLDGRVVAVSGATSGIGRAAAEGFARLGAGVRLLVRSRERGEEVRSTLMQDTGNRDVGLVECDLSSLASVRRCAAELGENRLDVLVNNAGVLPERREVSADGIELTFATNVVGPFLLTRLLVPRLERSAPARVINVSSGGMYGQRIHVDDLEMLDAEFNGTVAYARSKRAQVILTEEWAQRLRPGLVSVHAMHPGWVDTPGLERSLPRFRGLLRSVLRTPEQGADTIVWLGAAPSGELGSGRFWHDRRTRPVHLVPWTRERAGDRAGLWARCEELIRPFAEPGLTARLSAD